MRSLIFAAALSAAVSISQAQTTVTLTKILDMAVTHQSYSAAYDPATDKFLIGGSLDIEIFNGATGADEGTLSNTGITPAGLGFFAIAAAANGSIYAYEDGGANLWKWEGTTDTQPALVFSASPFERIGATGSTTSGTVVAFTGSSDSGPVDFYFDDGSTFTYTESPAVLAKSALAVNNEGTVVFAIPDVDDQLISKFVKIDGIWTQDPLFAPTLLQGGPLAYDEIHNILFTIPAVDGLTLKALDGASGNELATATVTTNLNGTPGYNGGYVSPTLTGGTVWLAGRALGGSTQAALYKFTYTITPEAGVYDWAIY